MVEITRLPEATSLNTKSSLFSLRNERVIEVPMKVASTPLSLPYSYNEKPKLESENNTLTSSLEFLVAEFEKVPSALLKIKPLPVASPKSSTYSPNPQARALLSDCAT